MYIAHEHTCTCIVLECMVLQHSPLYFVCGLAAVQPCSSVPSPHWSMKSQRHDGCRHTPLPQRSLHATTTAIRRHVTHKQYACMTTGIYIITIYVNGFSKNLNTTTPTCPGIHVHVNESTRTYWMSRSSNWKRSRRLCRQTSLLLLGGDTSPVWRQGDWLDLWPCHSSYWVQTVATVTSRHHESVVSNWRQRRELMYTHPCIVHSCTCTHVHVYYQKGGEGGV